MFERARLLRKQSFKKVKGSERCQVLFEWGKCGSTQVRINERHVLSDVSAFVVWLLRRRCRICVGRHFRGPKKSVIGSLKKYKTQKTLKSVLSSKSWENFLLFSSYSECLVSLCCYLWGSIKSSHHPLSPSLS